ncbi:MAG: class I SAM-dependent methyltransferase [Promethearchaeota archaeon]
MKDRGENSFIKLSRCAARLYDKMMQLEPMKVQRVQIAQELLNIINKGRLLDIGTGHGRLLVEINNINPNIELYGIDISEKMIELAKNNLNNIHANLQQGNICSTNFQEDFFDLITCTGSLYLWNSPIEALNEINRILKPGKVAILFESHKEYNKHELKEGMKSNLQNESFLNRKIVPFFLKKQLKMTYQLDELNEIINKSLFSANFTINKIILANLPIWLKIELKKV